MRGSALQAGAVTLRRCAVWLFLLAFPPAIAANQAETEEAALSRIRTEIHQLVGSARCRNLVHCRLLALGVSPCGGPSEYVAYSSAFTDVQALETKSSEFAFLQGELVDRQAPPAHCAPRPEPQAQCIDNHCRVVPGK